MNENKIFNSNNLKTALVIAIAITIISLGVNLFQPPKYQSSSKLLIVINQENIDNYSAIRTAGYVAEILSEVAYSSSFVDNVLKSEFNVQNDFGNSPQQREKNWKKTVTIKTQEDKGIIIIDTFHTNRNQADNLNQAVTYLLSTRHQLYHGLGNRVAIKVINAPVTPEKWAQPKILRNSLLGLAAGLIVGLTFIIIFPEQKILTLFHKTGREPHQEPKDFEFIPRHRSEPTESGSESLANHSDQPIESKTENQYYNW
ncbi:MAG TPA: hypothetical protein PK619_03900 [bacterium]|nr:hypothetical protein [bacterium]HPW39822.1 hypothetical protein [bacterium]